MSETDRRHLTSAVFVRRTASPEHLRQAACWEVWNCAEPTYAHRYEQGVTLCVEQGAARVTFATGEVVDLQVGDLLTIHPGAEGVWTILQPIRNRYRYA